MIDRDIKITPSLKGFFIQIFVLFFIAGGIIAFIVYLKSDSIIAGIAFATLFSIIGVIYSYIRFKGAPKQIELTNDMIVVTYKADLIKIPWDSIQKVGHSTMLGSKLNLKLKNKNVTIYDDGIMPDDWSALSNTVCQVVTDLGNDAKIDMIHVIFHNNKGKT